MNEQGDHANEKDPGDLTTVGPDHKSSISTAEHQEGATLGTYRLIRLLGRGGFGQVWEVSESGTERRLALKLLTKAHRSSPELMERFRREGKLAASVNHPRCVFIIAAEELDGYPVITMELMRGGTLHDCLVKQGPLPEKQAIDRILDVIEGLEAASDAGILHRDVKPSNCFLDESGRAKIGDFGISKTLESSRDLTQLTETGAFLGTPSYASPEQICGREVGLQSDIYSVGATLYALLTGAPPFAGSNAGQIAARIAAEEPTPFSRHSVRVSREVQEIVLRAISKDQKKRFQSYAEMRAVLLPFSSEGLTASSLVKRFVAFNIDLLILAWLVWGLNPASYEFSVRSWYEQIGLLIQWLLTMVVGIPYFVLSEKRWGRTFGKYLLRLRVTATDGSPLTYRNALVRTGALFLLCIPAMWVGSFPGLIDALRVEISLYDMGILFALDRGTGSVWFFVGTLLSLALVIFTMRSRNGFAGLHEVLSKTQVRDLARREGLSIPQPPIDSKASPSPAKPYGPYEILETIWRRESEALLVARDRLLDRRVWIHEQPADSSQPMTSLAEIRAGRLYWLSGNREGSVAWDAYEAPSGISFYQWVCRQGALSWAEVRRVLLAVSCELRDLHESGNSSLTFSIHNIWIASSGNPKLLNFHTEGDGAGDRTFRLNEWALFIRQITWFGLTGIAEPTANGMGEVPRVPMPEYARPLVERITRDRGRITSLPALIEELKNIDGRPAKVSRMRRVAVLLTALTPAVFAALTLGYSALIGAPYSKFDERYALSPELIYARIYIPELLARENPEQGYSRPEREAVSKVLAYRYRQAVARDEKEQIKSLNRRWPPKVLAEMATISQMYPEVSAAEVTAAWRARFHFFLPLMAQQSLLPLLEVGVLTGVCSLLLASAFGTSLLFRAYGMTLQTSRGQPASRLRWLLRSAVTWAPFLLLAPFWWLSIGTATTYDADMSRRFGEVNFEWLPWEFVIPSLMLGLIGVVYSVYRPERGIPDLIAGTHLVPR